MNHKLTKFNLDRLRRDKLEIMRVLQKEISKIEESISFHKRMYLLHEKQADDAREILAGQKRQTVRDVIQFLIGALKDGRGYFEYYKDIEVDALLDNEAFFDLAIIEIGKPTIKEIMNTFDKVHIVDGEKLLHRAKGGVANDNTRNRLWKKLTKKSILTEAKRLTQEMKEENEQNITM